MYYYNTRAHPGSVWPWIPLPDETWRGIPIAPFLMFNLLFSIMLTGWSFIATFSINNMYVSVSTISLYGISTILLMIPSSCSEFYLSTAIGIFMTYIFIEAIILYHRAELTKQFIFPIALLGSCSWMFVFLVVSVVDTSAVAWGGEISNFKVDQTLLALAGFA